MMTRKLWVVVACWVGSACGAAGCVRSPGAQLETHVNTMSRETDPKKLTRMGDAYATLGDFTRAGQYFAMAIESGGEEADIAPKLIDVAIRGKQYRAALFHAQDYLRRNPGDTNLRLLVANLHSAVGDTKSAKKELLNVLRARSEDAEAHFALAVILRDDEGALGEADAHFRAYLQHRPSGSHAQEARGSLLRAVQ